MRKKRTEAQLKKEREWAKKRRENNNHIVIITCKECGENAETKAYKLEHYKKIGGINCKKCISKMSRERMKLTRSRETKEERSLRAKKGNASIKRNRGETVKKQWDNFRKDPEKFKNICDAKSERMKKVWAEKYSDDKKNKIIKALIGSEGKSRSKISEDLKNMMIDENIYEGFISEEPFHGFIPDEINHNIRLIIEFYGDFYHCNPRKYMNPDQYIRAIKRTVGEQWKRDRMRLACFNKHGYSVLIVWEKDFRKNPKFQIERIKNEIIKKSNIK